MYTSPCASHGTTGVGVQAKHQGVFFLVRGLSRRAVPQQGDACRRWAAGRHSLQAAPSGARARLNHRPTDGSIPRPVLRQSKPPGRRAHSLSSTRKPVGAPAAEGPTSGRSSASLAGNRRAAHATLPSPYRNPLHMRSACPRVGVRGLAEGRQEG